MKVKVKHLLMESSLFNSRSANASAESIAQLFNGDISFANNINTKIPKKAVEKVMASLTFFENSKKGWAPISISQKVQWEAEDKVGIKLKQVQDLFKEMEMILNTLPPPHRSRRGTLQVSKHLAFGIACALHSPTQTIPKVSKKSKSDKYRLLFDKVCDAVEQYSGINIGYTGRLEGIEYLKSILSAKRN